MPALITDKESGFEGVEVGNMAPDFVLTDSLNNEWRLSDQRGKVVVLLFYPQNETLMCTRQLCSVRDHWKDYLATKAVVVGISPATPEEHYAFAEKRNLPIPLLADEGRPITKLYAKHWLFPVNLTRAVVVIDAHGMIRNRDIMLRAFRPSDTGLIRDIYAARGDALNETFEALKERITEIIPK